MPIVHRIPPEIKKDIIEVIEHVEKYIPICPPKYLKYLFEVYNKYIAPSYRLSCKGCFCYSYNC
jgi:hypothetical protein